MSDILSYREYLNSPEWKAKASVVKAFAKWRCQLCGRELPGSLLSVHHNNDTSYERLGLEEQADLICLCQIGCHLLFEFNKKFGEEFRGMVQTVAKRHGRLRANLADVGEAFRGMMNEAREFLDMAEARIEMAQAGICYSREWQEGMREGRAA